MLSIYIFSSLPVVIIVFLGRSHAVLLIWSTLRCLCRCRCCGQLVVHDDSAAPVVVLRCVTATQSSRTDMALRRTLSELLLLLL